MTEIRPYWRPTHWPTYWCDAARVWHAPLHRHIAGWGVVWQELSRPSGQASGPSPEYVAEHGTDVAELYAIYRAVRLARIHHPAGGRIHVVTDSHRAARMLDGRNSFDGRRQAPMTPAMDHLIKMIERQAHQVGIIPQVYWHPGHRDCVGGGQLHGKRIHDRMLGHADRIARAARRQHEMRCWASRASRKGSTT